MRAFPTWSRAIWRAAVIAAAIVLAASSPALGQSGGKIARPMAGQKVTSGVKLVLDTEGVEGLGYRRFQFQLTFPKPLAADADVRIVVSPYTQRYRFRPITEAEAEFSVPQGSATYDADVLVPLHDRLQMIRWEIWINGRKASDISSNGPEYFAAPTMTSEAACSIIVLDAGSPNIGPLKAVMSARGMTGTAGSIISSSGAQRANSFSATTLANVQLLSSANAPESWLAYTGVDLIVVDIDQLALFAGSRPSAYRALRRWVAQGGSLCVTGVGENYDRLAEIDEEFPGPPPAPEEPAEQWAAGRQSPRFSWTACRAWNSSKDVPIGGRGYYGLYASDGATRPSIYVDQQLIFGPPPTSDMNGAIYGASPYGLGYGMGGYGAPPVGIPVDGEDSTGEGSAESVDESQLPEESRYDDVGDSERAQVVWGRLAKGVADGSPPLLMLRRWRFGLLVAAPESLAPGTEVEWVHLLGQLGTQRTNWVERHGVSLHAVNASFDDYGVPGVGLPPVNAFRVLITIFVLAIGPLNYFWLQRVHRQHLLIITVPIAAVGVTIALFFYALLDDGLETRLAPSTLSFLDDRNGELTTWSLLSYYSGLAPRGGLEFSDETAVYPVSREDAYVRRAERARTVVWREERQRLASGWLPSRTPTELLAIRSTTTRARLLVDETPEDGAAPTAGNQLGTKIKQLFLVDSRGEHFVAKEIAPGEQVELQSAPENFSSLLRNIVFSRAGSAGAMPGLGPQASRGYYSYGDEYGSTIGDFHTSLMESLLSEFSSSRFESLMGTRRFVAVVERPPEFEPGCEARIVQPFHVVIGSY